MKKEINIYLLYIWTMIGGGSKLTECLNISYWKLNKKEFTSILNDLNNLQIKNLPIDEQVVLHNNLGVILIALNNFKEGSKEIKEAVKIFKTHFEEIKQIDEKRFKKWHGRHKSKMIDDTEGYYWETHLFPYEEISRSIFQNLATIYILERNYKEAHKALEEAKIKREIIGPIGKEIKEKEEKFSKRIEKAKQIKFKIKGK